MTRLRKRTLLMMATLAVGLLGASAALAQQDKRLPGQVPRIKVGPSELKFDKSGEQRQFTLRNVGSAPLSIREVRLGPGDDAFGLEPYLHRGVGLYAGKERVNWPLTLKVGEALTGYVSYTFKGELDKEPKQAFGSLQVVSDDPRFADRKYTTGLQLVKGKSYLLTVMVFFPLFIAGVMLLPFFRDKNTLRLMAVIGASVPFVLAIYLFMNFDRSLGMGDANSGLQYIHHFVWIQSFNIEFFFGVDGISISMVLLTGLVSLIAVGAAWSVSKQIKGFFVMFLLLETGMLGVFCSIDFFLFYVFWEVMLLPMYFLIGVWGAPSRVEADGRVRGGPYAAIKFFLYTLAGSVAMLLAMIALYFATDPTTLINGTPAVHTFDLMKMTQLNNFSAESPLFGIQFDKLIWFALFIGFAIKIPMFPFHTWLPDAHVEAPTAISVILAGVLLKMGTYGIMRINFQVLPEATAYDVARYTMAIFGVISILYGGLCAMAQKDLKRLVAYSSVSHMGFCLLGMASFTEAGMNGAMLQMFNHGTITSMLFILVGVVYDRAHTRGVDDFGGLAAVMPKYTGFFGFAFMASLGLPGLSGFISEVMIFIGGFGLPAAEGSTRVAFQLMVVLAASGVIITAAYHLWAIHRIHLGPFNPKWSKVLVNNDLNFREGLTLVPLAIIVLILGFYPLPVLDLFQTGMHDLVVALQQTKGVAPVAMLP
jgi:NADH-quinone oxidoreductase subunit M